MQTLQKKKILGAGGFASIARGYDTTSRVFEGWWHGWPPAHTATATATCTSATSTGTTTGGTGATTGSTTTGTATTLRRCVQLSSISHPAYVRG
jgi:hypothetical protein